MDRNRFLGHKFRLCRLTNFIGRPEAMNASLSIKDSLTI